MADVSPAYLRVAAIINGVLALVGVWAAVYVYLKFPHPSVIERAGRYSNFSESIESYIFSYPALQVALFMIPAIQSLRWKSVSRLIMEQETDQKAKNPRLQRLDAVLLFNVICGFMVIVEAILLGLTIYRASVLATNTL